MTIAMLKYLVSRIVSSSINFGITCSDLFANFSRHTFCNDFNLHSISRSEKILLMVVSVMYAIAPIQTNRLLYQNLDKPRFRV